MENYLPGFEQGSGRALFHKDGPTVQGIYRGFAFTGALHGEKLKSPLFSGPVGAVVTNDWCNIRPSVPLQRRKQLVINEDCY